MWRAGYPPNAGASERKRRKEQRRPMSTYSNTPARPKLIGRDAMNVARERGESKPAAIVITGDGKREFKLLRAIAKRQNGLKTLRFPAKPLPTHGAFINFFPFHA